MITQIFLLFCISKPIYGYIVGNCTDTYNNDMQCSCAFTENIDCPPNFYCPEYSNTSYFIPENLAVLNQANCKWDGTYQGGRPYIKCPCTPGFYCPKNTAQPTYCCSGYYCPSDSSISTKDGSGMGTWGSKAYLCPDKKFCVNAQVQPFDCPPLGRCPSGSDSADKTGSWAILIVAIILIVIGFYIL